MKDWLIEVGIGTAAVYALKYVYRYLTVNVPNKIKEHLNASLEKAFYAGDDIDDMWLLGSCIYVQMKYENQDNAAALKYADVAAQLIEKVKIHIPIYLRPFLNIDNEKIKEVIEKAVEAMKTANNEKIAQYFNGALHTYWRFAPESKRVEFITPIVQAVIADKEAGKTIEESINSLSKKVI